MKLQGVVTSVYIPRNGQSFTVGKNNVSSISKTANGVCIFFANDTYTEYTDMRCVFEGKARDYAMTPIEKETRGGLS